MGNELRSDMWIQQNVPGGVNSQFNLLSLSSSFDRSFQVFSANAWTTCSEAIRIRQWDNTSAGHPESVVTEDMEGDTEGDTDIPMEDGDRLL